MIGQTISHYKILEKLGEGGMGVVYKAQDTTLDRIVAVKFLPHNVTASATDKERFLQEAKAAAMLNHPNICTIHSVEESGEEMFIVMEHVDGPTLRKKLPIQPTSDAVGYAIQIGEALQEAHAKGIVHRDIKADNVMLNSKNQIKVMDFGLAKLKGALKLTRSSSTVGTLGYMAPEQIQGKEADARSDIFAFGVLFYEMLTGRLPFRGEHQAAMMYSIVNEEPQPIQQFVPDIFPEIVHILDKALEKDPAERYHNIEDIVVDLRRMKKQTSRVMRSSAGISAVHQAASISTESIPPASRKPMMFAGAGALLLILGAAAWFLLGSSSAQLNANATIVPLEMGVAQYEYPGISRDGKWLVFPGSDAEGTWDIYLMYLENRDVKKITSERFDSPGPSALNASFSPDGGTIVYTRWRRGQKKFELATVNVLGGSSRVVALGGAIPTWNPAGDRIGFLRVGVPLVRSASGKMELWTVKSDGTDERLEFIDTLGGQGGGYSFGWSPDGGRIVFQRWSGRSHELVVHDLKNGNEKTLTHDNASIDEVRWADNGKIFFSSTKGGRYNIWMTDENGSLPQPVTRGEGPDMGVVVSSSGNRLVYRTAQQRTDLWRIRLDGSELVQLTKNGKVAPQLSNDIAPDGSHLYFTLQGERTTKIVRTDHDGNHMEVLVDEDKKFNLIGPRVSPNDRQIVFTEFTGLTDTNRIMVLPLDRSSQPRQISRGLVAYQWYDDQNVMVVRPTGTWLVDIVSRSERLFFKDSINALPVLNGKYLATVRLVYPAKSDLDVVYKLDSGGRWIPGSEKRFMNRDTLDSRSLSYDNDAFHYIDNANNVWRIDYLTGRRTKVSGFLSGMTPIGMKVRYDGREMLFVNSVQDSRITMLDGLFTK
jgi:serine/threonine protein kinase